MQVQLYGRSSRKEKKIFNFAMVTRFFLNLQCKLIAFRAIVSLLLVLIASVVGCKQNKPTNPVDNFSKNSDSTRIENIKWLMYALNNNGKINATDMSGKTAGLSVVEFDLVTVNTDKRGDTLSGIFSFYKNGVDRISMSNVLPVRGLAEINGKVYYLDFYHLIPDFSKKEDSVQWYINIATKDFERFLTEYKGEMSPWLKTQAVKRGLIQP